MSMLKILIPVDGSERSLDAVHHALALTGRGLRARFVVANVQSPANLYELVVAHNPQVLQQVSEAAGRDLMRPAVELLQAAGLQVEQDVATGDPAPTNCRRRRHPERARRQRFSHPAGRGGPRAGADRSGASDGGAAGPARQRLTRPQGRRTTADTHRRGPPLCFVNRRTRTAGSFCDYV